ncbi:MAG: tetratricopeptide repeat protein [Sphingosinicella sp.]
MIRIALLLALLLLSACANSNGSPFARGATAFDEGDYRTARVLLLNAIQARPNDPAVRLLQARVLLALGDGAAAESEVTRARQRGVSAADSAHLFAHARLLQGDAIAALAESERAGDPHRGYAARIAGKALMAMGDMGRAQRAFDRATALSPDDSKVWSDFGRFRRAVGDLAGALAAADRAVTLDPRNVEGLLLRGELTRGQYGLEAALPWFDRVLEVSPDFVPALLERAVTLGDLGRMRDMLADIRAVNRLTGGHTTAYYLQAVLAARAGNFTLARLIHHRTGGAFDGVPAGMLLYGAIELETGNVEQAARRLSQLVAIQPGNAKARRLLAAAQWRRGDAAGVIEALRPIVGRPDADSYSLSLFGRALASRGEPGAAARYLARAALPQVGPRGVIDVPEDAGFARLRRDAAAHPGDGPLQVRLVAALLGRGRHGEALALARRLQADNPGAPEVHVLVGDALVLARNDAAAAEQYRRAANLAFTEAVAMRLVESLNRSGQGQAADTVLDLYLRQHPRSVPARILLGGRLMQVRDWEGAVRLYSGLRARIGDNDAAILNNLAWAHGELGQYAEALPLARRAWALDRGNPATAETLGWLLFKSGGNRRAGLVLLARAARGAPTNSDIARRLAAAQRTPA